MKARIYILGFMVLAIFVIAGFFFVRKAQAPPGKIQNTISNIQVINNSQNLTSDNQLSLPAEIKIKKSQTIDPLPNTLSRITKKPFGILINPKTSPVQPERFQGYHTGTDLETLPSEQDTDIPVKVLCDGKLLIARNASGYGGVAVQSCLIDGQEVTVIYGHIRLASMKAKMGDSLQAGDFLAFLGTEFSNETDGERKHLHLGIHRGQGINILGYVKARSDLSAWLDPKDFLN